MVNFLIKFITSKHFSSKFRLYKHCFIKMRNLSGIEELVNMNLYPNRSEVIRVAIRDLLKTELSVILRKKE
jgi:hypothetical protein